VPAQGEDGLLLLLLLMMIMMMAVSAPGRQ
jgi:hypothetical protein